MKKYTALFFSIIFTLLIAFTINAQPKFHTIPNYNMKVLNMDNPDDPRFHSIPVENPLSVFREPDPGYSYDNSISSYEGYRPKFAHQTVGSGNGEILFYMVDEFIYNTKGKYFKEYGTNYPFDLSVYGDNPILHKEVIVIPKPNSCNRFYIFHAKLYDESTHGLIGFPAPEVFVTEIEYVNDEFLKTISSARLSNSLPTINGSGFEFSMDITSYNPIYEDHVFYFKWLDKLYLFKVIENFSGMVASQAIVDINPDPSTECISYPSIGTLGIDPSNEGLTYPLYGAKRPDVVLTSDYAGNILLMFASAHNNVYGNPRVSPSIFYIKLPRNFTALQSGNSYEKRSLYYDRCYSQKRGTYNDQDVYRNICGMELSPDKKYLYVTFMEMDSIYYFDIESFMNGESEFPQTYKHLPIAGNYRYSELERFADGKIYAVDHHHDNAAVNDYGTFTTINDPNNPENTTFSYNCFGGERVKRLNIIRILNTYGDPDQWMKRYIFNHQIDDSDYETHYPIKYATVPNWSTIPLSQSWQPGINNNPFKSESGKIYFNSSFTIPSNYDISADDMEFYFPANEGMYISQGASVSFSECKLGMDIVGCNRTDQGFWRGITVQGQQGVSHTSANERHGVLMLSRSTVENALDGVLSKDGGKVMVWNSTFINNKYGITFTSFSEPHADTQIERTEFVTDKVFAENGSYPIAHIYMNDVKGIVLNGNTFRNTLPDVPTLPAAWDNDVYYVNYRGIGILSLQSSFNVSTRSLGNQFEGLYYGIYADGQKQDGPIIKTTIFENNFRGIYLEDTQGATVVANTIVTSNSEIPYKEDTPIPGQESSAVRYGAYLNTCRNFVFEKNVIEEGQVGLYVYNTGAAAGVEVYKNTFENTLAATIVVGKNANDNMDIHNHIDHQFFANSPNHLNSKLLALYSLSYSGLQVRCNKYSENGHAISIINGNMRTLQGDQGTEPFNPAGNQFSLSRPNNVDFSVELTSNHYEQYYKYYSYYQHLDPLPNNGFHRELREDHIFGVDGITASIPYSDASCPARNSGIARIPLDEMATLDLMLKNKVTNYVQSVDNGNTGVLRNMIINATPMYYNDLVNNLSLGGYLSNVVYEDVILAQNITDAIKSTILINNSPMPTEMVSLLKEANMNLQLKEKVLSNQKGMNARVKLEHAMGDLQQTVSKHESDFMYLAVNDSLDEYEIDSLITYFSDRTGDSYRAYMNLFDIYLSSGKYDSAKLALIELTDFAVNNLNQEEQEEIDNYCAVNHIYLQAIKSGIIDKDQLEKNLKLLSQVVLENSPLYSARAKVLYQYIINDRLAEYTPLPNDPNTIRSMKEVQNVKPDNLFKPSLKVYPNPSIDMINVEYSFENVLEEANELLLNNSGGNCTHGTVRLYAQNGALLLSDVLSEKSGIKKLNLENFASGIYTLEISDCYGNSKSILVNKQ